MRGRSKGTPKTGGRTKGTPNKLSSDIKKWIGSILKKKRNDFIMSLDNLRPDEFAKIYL